MHPRGKPVERTTKGVDIGHPASAVRFTDYDLVFGVTPPINRWAIIGRPLPGLRLFSA